MLTPCRLVKLVFSSSRCITSDERQRLIGGDKPGASGLQIAKNRSPFRLVERLDRIFNNVDSMPTAQQAIGCAEHAVFRDNPKYKKMRPRIRHGFL